MICGFGYILTVFAASSATQQIGDNSQSMSTLIDHPSSQQLALYLMNKFIIKDDDLMCTPPEDELNCIPIVPNSGGGGGGGGGSSNDDTNYDTYDTANEGYFTEQLAKKSLQFHRLNRIGSGCNCRLEVIFCALIMCDWLYLNNHFFF